MVSAEKSPRGLMLVLLFVTCCFALAAFKILILSLISATLIIVCLGVVLLGLILFGTHSAGIPGPGCLCPFPIRKVFSYYVFRYVLCPFLSLSSGTHITQTLVHTMLSERSL